MDYQSSRVKRHWREKWGIDVQGVIDDWTNRHSRLFVGRAMIRAIIQKRVTSEDATMDPCATHLLLLIRYVERSEKVGRLRVKVEEAFGLLILRLHLAAHPPSRHVPALRAELRARASLSVDRIRRCDRGGMRGVKGF